MFINQIGLLYDRSTFLLIQNKAICGLRILSSRPGNILLLNLFGFIDHFLITGKLLRFLGLRLLTLMNQG